MKKSTLLFMCCVFQLTNNGYAKIAGENLTQPQTTLQSYLAHSNREKANERRDNRLALLKDIRESRRSAGKSLQVAAAGEYGSVDTNATQANFHRPTRDEWYRSSSEDRNVQKNSYWPVEAKFGNVDLLDFSGIAPLHDRHFYGSGVKVFVEEVGGMTNVPELRLNNVATPAQRWNEHSIAVAGIIRKIAPEAILSGGDANDGLRSDADIINCSWGQHIIDNSNNIIEIYTAPNVQNKLVLFAIGNGIDGLGATQALNNIRGYKYAYGELNHKKEQEGISIEEQLKNILWVVNVTSFSVASERSNYPDTPFANHTISALGTDVEVMRHVNEYRNEFPRKSGTSFAAPTVTGVAALIKGAFPVFSAFDIKTCLLESADSYVFENYTTNGNYGIKTTSGNSNRIKLDPRFYGKGLLNANHAMVYAEILNAARKNNPTLQANAPTVIAKYKKYVEIEEKFAARKIQQLKHSPGFKRAKERLKDEDYYRNYLRSDDRERILSRGEKVSLSECMPQKPSTKTVTTHSFYSYPLPSHQAYGQPDRWDAQPSTLPASPSARSDLPPSSSFDDSVSILEVEKYKKQLKWQTYIDNLLLPHLEQYNMYKNNYDDFTEMLMDYHKSTRIDTFMYATEADGGFPHASLQGINSMPEKKLFIQFLMAKCLSTPNMYKQFLGTPESSFQEKIDELSQENPQNPRIALYKMLMLADKLSSILLQQANESNTPVLRLSHTDFSEFENLSGINKAQFINWFKEIYNQYNERLKI